MLLELAEAEVRAGAGDEGGWVAAGLPPWFREGLVEYLSGGGARAVRLASGAPDSAMRQRASPAEARRAYEQAAGRVAGLVARYGEAAVLGWVRSGLPAEVKEK